MSEMFLQATGIEVAQGLATVLLVDGENIPQSLAGQIICKSLPFGRPIVQRIYGDVARLPNWREAAGFEMIHTGHAKNGADMRMVIDALDLVHRGGVGRVVLASSDRDFTHLAHYLRAKWIEVIGMGEAKTHESFRKACSRFVELGAVAMPPATQQVATERPKPHRLTELDRQISDLIKGAGADGVLVQDLSVAMTRQHSFKITSTGMKTWRSYLKSKPELFVLPAKGLEARVRLK
jgi:hypothetical protein